jgi:phosphatidate phosphatase LPIN
MHAIASNGYHIIYLTSRPLLLADRTRRYLQSLGMPVAPVITSADSASASVTRELTGLAHLFKIEALEGVARTFRTAGGGSTCARVFHSAFGNRNTDLKAYAAAGIQPERIFIIDVHGRVTRGGASSAACASGSYAVMLQRVNQLFPPLAA